MKKPPWVALFGGGSLGESPLARVYKLGECLGPVQASSLRVASRIANMLRAGHAVGDYQDFEDCNLVLIAVPDNAISAAVAELADRGLPWTGKTCVLCSNRVGCQALEPLARMGALTGSLALVPGFEERWFLLEASRKVRGQMGPLLNCRGVRVTLIDPGHKGLYAEALKAVESRFLPLLQQAAETLRSAGVPNAEVAIVLEKLLTRNLHSYFRSGKVTRKER